LELDRKALPEHPSLNQVVCAHLAARGNPNEIYTKLSRILKSTAFDPPEPLRQLAEIEDFGLYVSLSFDSLLSTALDQARHGGAARTRSFAYTPNGSDHAEGYDDLPNPVPAEPLVFQLFGKASASPDYAVSDEDLLEFVRALHFPDRRPQRLFDELARKHLLFLGCRYSDWLSRFLLRLSKDKRLSDKRASIEILVDAQIKGDGGWVRFCDHFSANTHLLHQPAEDFVAELHRRWRAMRGQPAPPSGGAAPPVAEAEEVPEMEPGAIFISYASEDRAVARVLHDALEGMGLDAWFDQRQLTPGDHWDKKIRQHVEQCSLFVPLVSSHTERRLEGYFRREWNWAAKRTEAIAHGVPFILPVRVDDIGDPRQAHVPEAFQETQWTPWTDPPPPEFLGKLRDLLRAYRKRQGR
jgi:hypothetical protein